MNNQADQSEKKKKGVSPWTWVALGCGTMAIFSITGIALFVFFIVKVTAVPVEVANSQLKAIRGGDIDAAYRLTSRSFRDRVSLIEFEEFVGETPVLAENEKASFNDRNITNRTAKISGTIESSGGRMAEVEYSFVLEKGKWRINSIRIE